MAAKKKTRKKQTKSKTSTARRKPIKKTARKRPAKAKAPKKAPKKTSAKKRGVTASAGRKKAAAKTAKTERQLEQRSEDKSATVYAVASSRTRQGRPLSGRQSGDLQGLSRAVSADSESVDELLEEGNAFEADVVAGVQDADNADEREVRTHEVPEDDVPDEYLDKD